MALPAFATVEDLSGWIGESITDSNDILRAQGVLRLASSLVRRETHKTWMADDGSTLVAQIPEELQLVTCAVAARGYTNPEAATGDAIDDAQITGRVVDEAGLYLTDSEKRVLATYSASSNRGLSTVTTTRGERSPYSLRQVTRRHHDCDDDPILPPYYL